VTYPVARPGLAQQGLQVYRANGCACCHSQQVGQCETALDIVLTEAGTNQAVTLAALLKLATTSPDELPVMIALPPLEAARAKHERRSASRRTAQSPAAQLQPGGGERRRGHD